MVLLYCPKEKQLNYFIKSKTKRVLYFVKGKIIKLFETFSST